MPNLAKVIHSLSTGLVSIPRIAPDPDGYGMLTLYLQPGETLDLSTKYAQIHVNNSSGLDSAIANGTVEVLEEYAAQSVEALAAQVATLESEAVKLTGPQTIAGVKTFSSAPSVPDGSFTIAKTAGLQAALDSKAVDVEVVKLTGAQSIAGVKTFSAIPVVPDDSFPPSKVIGLEAALAAGGDFDDGGEAGGAKRTLGNTDAFDLGIITNNLERLTIKSDGNVGIGTTSPTSLLHVSGSGAGLAIARIYNTHAGNGHGLYISAGVLSTDVPLNLQNKAGAQLVRFRADGKVGIGTTSPTEILDVVGNIKVSGVVILPQTSPTATLSFAGDSDTGITWGGSDSWFARAGNQDIVEFKSTLCRVFKMLMVNSGIRNSDGSEVNPGYSFESGVNMGMRRAGANILQLVTAQNARLTIDAAGQVGIGDTSPNGRLHVVNTPQATSYSATDDTLIVEHSGNNMINVVTSPTGEGGLVFSDTGRFRGAILFKHSSTRLDFYVSTTRRMVIDSAGKVGIGTDAPAQALDVVGSIGMSGDLLGQNGVSNLGGASNRFAALFLSSAIDYTSLSFNVATVPQATLDGGGAFSGKGIIAAGGFGGGRGRLRISGITAESGSGQLQALNAAGGAGTMFYTGADYRWLISSEKMRLDVNGRLGIGTSLPVVALDVVGAINSTGLVTVGASGAGTLKAREVWLQGSSSIIRAEFDGNWRTEIRGENAIELNTGSNGVNKTMRLLSSGNVGIGAISPSHPLHILGGGDTVLKVESTGAAGRADLNLKSLSNGKGRIQFDDGGTPASIEFEHSNNFMWFSGPTGNYFMMNLAGKVGFGTWSPSATVHAVGGGIFTTSVQTPLVSPYPSTSAFTLRGGTTGGGAGEIVFTPGSGGGTNLGDLLVRCGDSTVFNQGGAKTTVRGGHSGSSTGTGGELILQSGRGGAGDNYRSGHVQISTPINTFGTSGDVNIFTAPGVSVNQDAGNINLTAGDSAFGTKGAITFSAAGLERMRVHTDGNVGIGTSAPTKALHVVGDGSFSGRLTIGDGTSGNPGLNFAGDGDTGIVRYSAGDFAFISNSNQKLRVGPSFLSVSDTIYFLNNTTQADPAIRLPGPCGMFSPTNNVVAFTANSVERMRISASGNVGIGETNPDKKLHVKNAEGGQGSPVDTILVLEDDSSLFQAFISPNTSQQGFRFSDPQSTTVGQLFYDHSDDSMRLHTNSGERVRVDSSGNVGIGTTPTAKLDVNSDIVRVRTPKTPASAVDTGNQGDIAWDSGFVYVCVAANTWKRAALATW